MEKTEQSLITPDQTPAVLEASRELEALKAERDRLDDELEAMRPVSEEAVEMARVRAEILTNVGSSSATAAAQVAVGAAARVAAQRRFHVLEQLIAEAERRVSDAVDAESARMLAEVQPEHRALFKAVDAALEALERAILAADGWTTMQSQRGLPVASLPIAATYLFGRLDDEMTNGAWRSWRQFVRDYARNGAFPVRAHTAFMAREI